MLAWKHWRDHNHSRQIFSAAVSVGLVSLMVKFLFMVKELFVAYQFGRSDALDAYVIAYALPAFLINFFNSVNGSAFIPAFLRIWTGRDRAGAQIFLSGVVAGNIVVSLLICAILWGMTVPILKVLGSGFTPEKQLITQQLFLLLVPATILGSLIANISALLRANEVFHAPVMSPLFTSVSVMLMLYGFGDAWGVYALAIGTLAGLSIELIYLGGLAIRLNWRLRPGWQWSRDDRLLFFRQLAPLAGGVLLLGSLELVDNSMASMLAPGSVSALSYGTRVSLALMGLTSVALGTVVLPRFSRLAAAGEWHEIARILRTFNRLIVIASVPLVVAIAYYSTDIIEIIYQRGAFTVDDTQLVGSVQAMYVLQLPFYLMGILGARVISAVEKNQWLLKIAAVSVMLNIAGNYVLMAVFGVAGIALATTLVVFFSWAMISFLTSRMINQRLEM